MKKIVLEIILVILFSFLALYFYITNNDLNKKNKKLYDFFADKEVLESNGNINISELESKRDGMITYLNDSLGISNSSIDELSLKLKKIESDNDELFKDITSLSSEVTSLSSKVNSLSSQYKSLNAKYNQLYTAKKNAETVVINGFPVINQYPQYPTGCESVSLTLLLKHNGVSVNVDGVIGNLKKGNYPYMENGVMYGGNPEIEFVGDPYSYQGYGVFEGPMADVANRYKSGINIRNNFNFDGVLELVKQKRPVMVWTSMNLAVPYISASWIYKPTSEKITWKANEHAVIVIGYNNDSVIISDPIGGKVKYQSKATFLSRYNYYGKRALYF